MKVSLYVFILVILFGLLSLMEIPPLVKNKQRKELFVVISLLSIGFLLNFLLIIGIKLPNPIQRLVTIIKSIVNLIF